MHQDSWKFFLIILVFFFSVQAAEIIKGTVADQSTSFDFNVNNPILGTFTKGTSKASVIFTSAAQLPTNADFTLARSSNLDPFAGEPFLGMSIESIKVNGVKNQPNPIRGAATKNLIGFASNIALVRTDTPVQVFIQENIFGSPKDASVVTTKNINIKDATGVSDAASIEALAAHTRFRNVNRTDQTGRETTQTVSDQFLFAAVAPNGGVFGGLNSGIASLMVVTETVNKPKKGTLVPFLDILNAVTGVKSGNTAARFDVTTDALKIGADLASIANVVDMHWDAQLKRLYIATDITGGAAGTDGARAVVVARLSENKLIFDAIAPVAVFDSGNRIVGSQGASAVVSLNKVSTMHTSTFLSYLIVAGPNTTDGTVYAMPLVDKRSQLKYNTNPVHGTLANKDSSPEVFFTDTGAFKARAFTSEATDATQAFAQTDAAAQVGASALPLSPTQIVSEMFVQGDAVFVAVSDTLSATTEPGLYQSQALFDSLGRIIRWTPWKRVAGTADKINGAVFDSQANGFIYLPTNTLNTIKRTQWSLGNSTSGSAGLVDLFSQEFPQSKGGIQGLLDFSRDTVGFNQTVGQRTSILIATGLNKIVLAETGRGDGVDFNPYFGSYAGVTSTFSSGEITTTFPLGGATRAIVMSGGVLSALGPIVTAEIATRVVGMINAEAWIFVGGVHGLAVLSPNWTFPPGAGSGLGAGFNSLATGMKFVEIGDYKFVRKVFASDGFLYVLTNTTFDRIELVSGTFAATTLATPESIGLSEHDSFSDMAVSEEVGLLATSQGLYRVGNGLDIQTGDSTNLNWTNVAIPNSIGPATRLLFGTSNGFTNDFSNNGQLYLLSSYVGYNQAQINRYAINFDTAISNTTIQSVPDFIFSTPSFLINFGAYRNFIYDDGALVTASRSRNNMPIFDAFLDPVTGLTQDPADKREGFAKFIENVLLAERNRKIPGLAQALSVGNVIRNSASGALLVPADSGLIVND